MSHTVTSKLNKEAHEHTNSNTFPHLQRFEKMPEGWRYDTTFGSPVSGYAPICNGKSMLNGGRKGLLRRQKSNSQPIVGSCVKIPTKIKLPKTELTDEEKKAAAKATNDLARAKFKEKLFQDLLFDLNVCKIEGWCIEEYVTDLKTLIDDVSSSVLGHNATGCAAT